MVIIELSDAYALHEVAQAVLANDRRINGIHGRDKGLSRQYAISLTDKKTVGNVCMDRIQYP